MKYGVFDIESNKMIEFLILGFFDGVEYRTFRTIRKFLDALNNKRYDGWRIYAHYGGRFDFLFLMEDIFRMTTDVRIIDPAGRIVSMTVRFRNSTIHFADSYALFPTSLKNVTTAFGVEHQKGVMNFKRRLEITPKVLKYLEGDVLGLYEVIQKYQAVEYIDEVKLTVGSQALDVFKRRFSNVSMETLPMQYEDTFRTNFYSGGRVEVYKGRGNNIHTYDVNSLYPSVMLEQMPCGKMQTTEHYHPGKIGFYCVDVLTTPDFYIPPYLVKTKYKNYFVNGKGRYFMSSATIEHLKKDYGVRFRVVYGFVFSGKDYLFNDFVNFFYGIKSTSTDPTLIMLAKFFLNSLYGKLGQSRRKETIVGYSKGKTFSLHDNLSAYGLVMVDSYSRSRFILPYLAAYITELARLEHWKYMQVDPEAVYYGDTDSIYTTSTKLKKFVSPKIGMLKDEGTYEGIFLLPKTYALRDKAETIISFKGFDPKKFTFEDFERAQAGESVLREKRERMLSFRECFRRKAGIGRSQSHFLKMVQTEKATDTAEYTKRKVIPNKKLAFNTLPYYITDVPNN